MSMPLPSERFEFPLIPRNEFSALQSSLLVELVVLPSPEGHCGEGGVERRNALRGERVRRRAGNQWASE